MRYEMPPARLLPWATAEGKPCYLVTDGTGDLSRVADTMETVQLGMAAQLAEHVAELLKDEPVTPEQLRFALERMSEALGDVTRVAESRVARIDVRDRDGWGDRGERFGPEAGGGGHG
ncbi:hypothetical protein [Streptomyces sp. WG-D5]